MNKSHLIHALIAVALHVIIGVVTKNWIYGSFLVFGIFWSREHAQAQMHIATATTTKLKDVAWYEGADMTKWNHDSLFDFCVPAICSIVVAYLGSTFL